MLSKYSFSGDNGVNDIVPKWGVIRVIGTVAQVVEKRSL